MTVYRAGRPARRRPSLVTTLLVAMLVIALGAGAYATYESGLVDAWRGPTASPSPTVAAGDTPVLHRDHPARPGSAFVSTLPPMKGDGVKVATFLGDEMRRSYGVGAAPARLGLIWSCSIGTGKTSGVGTPAASPSGGGADGPGGTGGGAASSASPQPAGPGFETWSGTGWTGQPALVRDKGRLYLLVGGFDHNLHKIDARTGKVIWEYEFPDVIKGSPTVIRNPKAKKGDADEYIVMVGSRRGYPVSFTDPAIAPYRAIAFGSGKELWRLPVPLTASYSRDADGSSFFKDGHLYLGVESGVFYDIDPFRTEAWNGFRRPKILHSRELLGDASTRAAHGGNLVLEASPALIKDTIYVASGSGFVYGMRRKDLKIVWQYRTGSDLDGSTATTADGKLLLPIEKQYISGHGGVMLLDPSKPPAKSPVWFFPTGDRAVGDWAGGVIGSCAVNDSYDPRSQRPRLVAFMAIDGNLYVVARDALAEGTVPGPNGEVGLRTPKLLFSDDVGGSISTPIFAGRDCIVAAGYDGRVHLYRIAWAPSKKGKPGALRAPHGTWWKPTFSEKTGFAGGGSFESTPIFWDGRVYIGSRGGSFYCLGAK